MTTAKTLHDKIRSGKMVVAPGAYDCITARVIEQAGFPAVYMTGAGTSAAHGLPDYGLLTMSEMVDNARRITGTIELPLISDSDTGYGNELNAFRTVQEFERAGVAAIHIEDQVFPKRCGHTPGKRFAQARQHRKSRPQCIARRRVRVAWKRIKKQVCEPVAREVPRRRHAVREYQPRRIDAALLRLATKILLRAVVVPQQPQHAARQRHDARRHGGDDIGAMRATIDQGLFADAFPGLDPPHCMPTRAGQVDHQFPRQQQIQGVTALIGLDQGCIGRQRAEHRLGCQRLSCQRWQALQQR